MRQKVTGHRARCCVDEWQSQGLTQSFEEWGKAVHFMCHRRRGLNCIGDMRSADMVRKVVQLEDSLEESRDSDRVVLLSHDVAVMGNHSENSLLRGRLQRHRMSLVLEAVGSTKSTPTATAVPEAITDGNPEWHEAKKPGQREHCTKHNHFHRAPAAGPVEARRQVQALSVVAAEVA